MINNKQDALLVISKSWLIGFTEAEGSFYITNIANKRFRHGFSINQKLDSVVLKAISLIIGIHFYPNDTIASVRAVSHKEVSLVVNYFCKTIRGMKALEYRI